MNFKVTISGELQKEAKWLRKKYPTFKNDLASLVASPKIAPQQGEPLGKDCYKIRFAITAKKKGKRSGARAITCVKIVEERVIILSLYTKGEVETIVDDELAQQLKNADLL